MEHKTASESLSAYLDGELSSAEKEAFEAHLGACEPCRSELSELRSLSSVFREAARVEAPPWLGARALARSKEPSASWLKPVLALSMAAAAVAVVVERRMVVSPTLGSLQGAVSDADERAADGLEPPSASPPSEVYGAASETASQAAAPAESKSTGAEDKPAKGAGPFTAGAAFDALEGGGKKAAEQGSSELFAGKGLARRFATASGGLAGSGAAAQRGAPSRKDEALQEFRKEKARSIEAESAGLGARERAGGGVGFAAAPGAESEESARTLSPVQGAAPAPEAMPETALKALDDEAERSNAAEAVEWKGSALYGPGKTSEVVVRDMKAWIKLWPLVSADALPLLDFDRLMVVGVIAGPGAGAVSLDAVEPAPKELVVRYTRRPKASAPSHQYHLRAVPKTDAPARFAPALK